MAKFLDVLYAIVTALSADATPSAANDYVMTVDASASGLKKVLIANLPTSSGALTTANAALSADVTMTSANTYYDGPSVSLAAGTWLVTGTVTLANTTSDDWTAKLWDGTTVYASAQSARNIANYATFITLSAIVSPGSTTTYKISVANDDPGGKIKAAAPTNAAGNTASTIWAVKIG